MTKVMHLRASRRQFVKGTSAATGALLAAGYVKPDLRSFGIPTALAVSPGLTLGPLTPGSWANSGDPNAGTKELWDDPNDPFVPFTQTTQFNSFFTAHPNLAGLTMYEVANQGGGSDPVKKAGRSLVAAYLNASIGSYPYTTAQLANMWNAAVATGSKEAFLQLHELLDAANNGGQ